MAAFIQLTSPTGIPIVVNMDAVECIRSEDAAFSQYRSTFLGMTSGNPIEVRESPEDIRAKLPSALCLNWPQAR